MGSRLPFAQAAEHLRFFWKAWLSDETQRRGTEAAGEAYVAVQQAERERLEQELPPPAQGPAVQQLSLDGAMVPLRHGAWAEVKTAAIGAVGERRGDDGNREVHTEDLSYFSRLAEVATFTQDVAVELRRRGTHTAGTVAAVSDGSVWIQGVLDTHRRDAVRILDFPHALEHLATAASATYGAATPAADAWRSQQAHTLKHETPEAVLAAVRALPVAAAADPCAAAQVRDQTLAYLDARLEQVRYADFQARGLPIGSGAVESACKLVVEARLKGSGMHWERANVNPMVALRTVACADRWAEAWPQIQQQLRQQHQQQRHLRLLRRHPPAAPPVPAPAPPKAPVHLSLAAERLRDPDHPKIVHGRPTSDHPWRRYAQTG